MFLKFAIRDGAILGLALGFWWLAAERSASGGALGDFTGVVAGALLTLSAYTLHEWGHLLAALAVGSQVRPGTSLRSGYAFSFGAEDNSLRQFLLMSLGGFAATAAAVWSFYTFLPDAWLASRVARGGVLFLAFLALTLEFPLVLVALYRGRTPVEAAVRLREPAIASE